MEKKNTVCTKEKRLFGGGLRVYVTAHIFPKRLIEKYFFRELFLQTFDECVDVPKTYKKYSSANEAYTLLGMKKSFTFFLETGRS